MYDARQKRKIYWEIASNVVVGLLYVFFAYNMTKGFVVTHRISNLFMLLYELLMALFIFIRHFSKRVSLSAVEWIAAMLGTYLPLLLQPVYFGSDISVLLVLQVAGIAVSMTGLLNLNKSFGFVPADRGIKTGGLYRYIRHPLYAGYIVSIGAYTAMNRTPANITIYLLFVFFEIVRLLLEESFLSSNEEYAAYMKKVRWRLIPFIF